MRPNVQIAVGTYTGDGNDNRSILVGFRPQLVFVKGGLNVMVWRSAQMRGDSAAIMNAANAANLVQELLNDGFQVGTDARVNANGTSYYYVAIRGLSAQEYFRTGNYVGDGNAARNYTGGGFAFTPDLVFLKRNDGNTVIYRTAAHTGDSTSYFTTTTNQTNRIKALIAGGFQLGSNAEANNNGSEYSYAALKQIPGAFAVGSYTGTGAAGLSISGLGFAPDAVFVDGNVAQHGYVKTKDMPASDAFPISANTAAIQTGITALNADGFTLGNSATVNTLDATHYWFAFKAGNYSVPLSRIAI